MHRRARCGYMREGGVVSYCAACGGHHPEGDACWTSREEIEQVIEQLEGENAKLRSALRAALQSLQFGAALMTLEQLGKWEGVRGVIERIGDILEG